MLKTYKTEINPTNEQIHKIMQTIGNCRFIYNYYLGYNQKLYQANQGTNLPTFITGYSFSKLINNDIQFLQSYPWLKETSSKATQAAIMQAETAYKRFFNGKSKFPKFKKKHDNNVKIHIHKNGNANDLRTERHRIKVPTFGWIKLKEKGYIPYNFGNIKSCSISKKSDRYYISVLVEIDNIQISNNQNEGIGIDLGVKELAICSDNHFYKNINKSKRIKKLKKKLKRLQRRFSKKLLNKNERGETYVTKSTNIDKQRLKVQKAFAKLTNIRTDYMNKVIFDIVKRKPNFITVEDLNIKGMMKNKHLSCAIAEQNLFTFKEKLKNKCKQYGIELRQVSRIYPSSKLCSCCGNKKNDLMLKDRTYICTNCGLVIDRDLNAAINLQLAKNYTVLT